MTPSNARLSCAFVVRKISWQNRFLPKTPATADSIFDRLRVVLVASRNPLNIGAAARAMSNFGFHHLRVVNSYGVAFREAKSAVGASAVLANAEEYTSVADAVADCALVIGTTAARNRTLHHPFRPLPQAARLIRNTRRAARIALLFGSEKRGLSNEDFSYCHWLLRIPTQEQHPSMNLGQAAAVCLYEISHTRQIAIRAKGPSAARSVALERVTALLLQSLAACGYLRTPSDLPSQEKTRRFVRRLKLSAEDAELLTGMLRQIAWKVEQP